MAESVKLANAMPGRSLAEYFWARCAALIICCLRVILSLILRACAIRGGHRHRMVNDISIKLETTQKDVFTELYRQYSMQDLEQQSNGTITGMEQTMYDPTRPTGHVWGAPTAHMSVFQYGSAAATDISFQDFKAMYKNTYIRELPQPFLEVLAAEPNNVLADEYRAYIRHEVKPAIDRVKDILHDNFSVLTRANMAVLMTRIFLLSLHPIVRAIGVYAIGWS
eukprot:SAG31_NODE_7326_length_1718_cov_2.975293_3_plen_223_part_00